VIRLKICGLQPNDDVYFAKQDMVSHVGIVFVPQSRRYVAPTAARQIVTRVGGHAAVVGVFVNASFEDLTSTQHISGIDVLQLHGQESVALCASLRDAGYTVWKAISVTSDAEPEALLQEIIRYSSDVDALLLDAAPPKRKTLPVAVTGGHGVPFDWRCLQNIGDVLPSGTPPIWIAGGLQSENVGSLFQSFSPYGVDVSSGVEEDGRKSPRRIEDMMEAMTRHAGKHDLS